MRKEFLRLVIAVSLILLGATSSSAITFDEDKSRWIVTILINGTGWLLVQIAAGQRFYLSEKSLIDGTTKAAIALYAFVIPLVLTSILISYPMKLELMVLVLGLLHVLLFSINPKSWVDFVMRISHGMSSDSWLDILIGRRASVQVRGLLFHLLGTGSIGYIIWKAVHAI